MSKASDLLHQMLRIRMVEEEIAERYAEQEMRCPVHLSIGQEAPAVGVCAVLQQADWVFSGHRNHAHYLAKGGDLKRMLAEIYGKETGCCGGRGGSMHLTDQQAGFIGATPIVGSTIPIAVGAALTAQLRGEDRVVVIFLGDGAVETGVFHESVNFACVRNLPVIFACEDNGYSVYSPMSVRQPPSRSLSELAAGHGIVTSKVDGNDVVAVMAEAAAAVGRAREEGSPSFIEMTTYRWREHCGPDFDNHIGYRSESEFEQWRDLDPIGALAASAHYDGTESELEGMKTAITEEIEEAFEFAKESPFPPASDAAKGVYA